ncbi:uncharacterized protein LOC113512830 isoform X2 [Galleria mellonella]|uniref:Uncharacterized protein LOC113512830 isoform X2 n=1 Tax=Galleria mellonella TaxID=7137 RepID=A0ABM3MGK3_GALME|nr:uncharacterized protein LOC113512830 isoform X2 [Galleria mellonella]
MIFEYKVFYNKTMRLLLYLVVLVCVTVCVTCKNHFFGEKEDARLVSREKIMYEAIPWKKRVQYYEYSDSPRPIKAIRCYDYQNSEASVNITEGGIGFDHVTLRMKSQRSYRLDYAIEIYA